MPEKFASSPRRNTLALDERVVRNGCAESFAPANALLHCLSCSRDGHGVKPPTLFRSQRLPVAQSVRDVVRRRFFHSPAQYAEFLAKRRMHRYWFGRILLKLGGWQAIRAQSAIGLFPESGSERQPAAPINQDPQ